MISENASALELAQISLRNAVQKAFPKANAIIGVSVERLEYYGLYQTEFDSYSPQRTTYVTGTAVIVDPEEMGAEIK